MKPFSRVKDFVRNHQVGVGFAAGSAVVIALTTLVTMKTGQTGVILNVVAKPEQLQELLQNPEGVIAFNVSPTQIVWITNSASKEIFP